MATITISKLHCVRKQDISKGRTESSDLGGQFAWEGKMSKDDWEYPNERGGWTRASSSSSRRRTASRPSCSVRGRSAMARRRTRSSPPRRPATTTSCSTT